MTPDAFQHLVNQGFNRIPVAREVLADLAEGGKYGARDLRRVIRKQVEDKVANLLVERGDKPPKGVNITAADGKIVVEAKD